MKVEKVLKEDVPKLKPDSRIAQYASIIATVQEHGSSKIVCDDSKEFESIHTGLSAYRRKQGLSGKILMSKDLANLTIYVSVKEQA